MFENDHSAARGKMAVRELIIFKHDCELAAPRRTSSLTGQGRSGKDGVTTPRGYRDYIVSVEEDKLPSGVTCTRMG